MNAGFTLLARTRLHARDVSSIPMVVSNDAKAAAAPMNAEKSTAAVSGPISRRLGVIRVLCLALLALSLCRISVAWSQEDEDHARLCPLLTEDLLQKVLPEVTGHGACRLSARDAGVKAALVIAIRLEAVSATLTSSGNADLRRITCARPNVRRYRRAAATAASG